MSNYELNDLIPESHQQAVLTSDARYKVAHWGRRTGKTLTARWSAKDACANESVIYIAAVFSLQMLARRHLLLHEENGVYTGLCGVYGRHDGVLLMTEYQLAQRVTALGIDKIPLDYLIVDEPDLMDQLQLGAILAYAESERSRILMIGTPSKKWDERSWFRTYATSALARTDGAAFQTSAKDVSHIDSNADWIEAVKKAGLAPESEIDGKFIAGIS